MRPLHTDWNDSGIIDSILRLAKQHQPAMNIIQQNPWATNVCFEQAIKASGTKTRAACVRLALGSMLEYYCQKKALSILHPSTSHTCLEKQDKMDLCQLYFDAYAVSTWTSAHAYYMYSLAQTQEDIPHPNIFMVPSAFTSPDFSILYERKNSPKSIPKEATHLVQLLSRCTNPGARGWEPVIQSACKCSVTKRVLVRELEICLLGLHPQLHPALRSSWKSRLKLMIIMGPILSSETSNTEIKKASSYLKEAIKRCIATMMANIPAMHSALSTFSHPCKYLNQPPINLPLCSFQAAMASFVESGKQICNAQNVEDLSIADILHNNFQIASQSTTDLRWSSGWMGKGTVNIPPTLNAVAFSESIWMNSFKTPFLSLWLHAWSKNIRMLKLDELQLNCVKEMTQATNLCASLKITEQLLVQRIALNTPDADLMTVQQVLEALGCTNVDAKIKTMSLKNAKEVMMHIKLSYGARVVAMLLFFGRVAWLKKRLTIVNFDDSITRLQCKTILRRLGHAVPEEETTTKEMLQLAYKKLPSQATCLCICTECERVANATVCSSIGDEKKITPFDELGLSQSMVRYSSLTSERKCLLCAKRSSAALRSNQAFQSFMTERKIESEELDEDRLQRMLNRRETFNEEFNIASKIRRDSKNAMEQREFSTSCGSCEMLQVPIIGRAVYIYDSCYTMCGKCACVIKLTQVHRFHDTICCLRCDNSMFKSSSGKQVEAVENTKKICRYCGSIDPERTGIRWKQIKAPLDHAGDNLNTPVPLRKVYYCPSHNRPWLQQAHRVLETKVILAHISTNAKPLFEISTDELLRPKRRRQSKKRKLTQENEAGTSREAA